ncbi:MAG: hypothetical protein HN657_00490 [Candidatus Marinimicrobia bacterium]|jgi:membrane-associated phospholipid phosphatase|nr:hypothetical protein [Candidatus Neomarinimicrobiota bacterium]MBT3496537.1 hypothetical protein [Candidatus Neomarinimicrobiota bacterium]MBT3691756.1 hypothetical protein [Candidatus Neomarinimicrobiota bacterium]MBT4144276.1 hypothetical protein [Candidatus Neomarinimicrobiota bacterium]MBT4178019.1 hypothetical protein [Candidatus Neomarinimicrobiota bacterium]
MGKNIKSKLSRRFKIILPFWVMIIGYFIILESIEPIPSPKSLYFLDQFIPFFWFMIIPYYLHYIGLLLPPILIKSETQLRSVTQMSMILTGICYGFFIFWPVSVDSLWNSIISNPLNGMYSILLVEGWDQNYFPSMHVTISCFFMWVFAHEHPKQKWIIYVIGFSIFFATFLTKQHFILDSIFGLILAYGGFKYCLKTGKFNHD